MAIRKLIPQSCVNNNSNVNFLVNKKVYLYCKGFFLRVCVCLNLFLKKLHNNGQNKTSFKDHLQKYS